jgi:hypothetical protein
MSVDEEKPAVDAILVKVLEGRRQPGRGGVAAGA